jgi:hypothetical protein
VISQGRFLDPNGSEWLFVSQTLILRGRDLGPAVAVAAPVPRPTLQQVFATFGNTFFTPLVRAAAVALLAALLLSALIARSVAGPLQQISRAAGASRAAIIRSAHRLAARPSPRAGELVQRHGGPGRRDAASPARFSGERLA